jgi:uncharacterized Ntn-hydrolase superfamily protein
VTFSIVAWDPDCEPSPEWGVAVASKFLAVGSVVAWGRAGAGAIATQAWANLTYGPNGLSLLSSGRSSEDVVRELTEADEGRAQRQLGVVDAQGRAATYTGEECFDWAGGRTGDGYCCQGNILAGPEVVDRMADAFESADGELASRLLAALQAGDDAGGDRRGKQSAAVMIVREAGAYGGDLDLAVDLRVDDHPDPVPELKRIFALHRLYFPRPEDLDFLDVDDQLAAELRRLLSGLGYEPEEGSGYDDSLRKALFEYVGKENLDERWTEDPRVEKGVIDHLRSQPLSAS